MSNITICVGDRLRRRRIDLGYTQEHLAELADVHPTYIGQVERGEKNVTIESLEKILFKWSQSAIRYLIWWSGLQVVGHK